MLLLLLRAWVDPVSCASLKQALIRLHAPDVLGARECELLLNSGIRLFLGGGGCCCDGCALRRLAQVPLRPWVKTIGQE